MFWKVSIDIQLTNFLVVLKMKEKRIFVKISLFYIKVFVLLAIAIESPTEPHVVPEPQVTKPSFLYRTPS